MEPPNDSTMNRISAKIPNSRIKYPKTTSKFDYRVLMNPEFGLDISKESPIIKSYDYWNARQGFFNEQDDNVKDQDLYKYQKIREKILEESGKSIEYVVNTLVSFMYTVRRQSLKKTLWACFGDVILSNIRSNLDSKSKVCAVCGKRFVPHAQAPHTLFCSDKCRNEYRVKRCKNM